MGLTRPRAHQLQDIDYKQTSRAITTTNITLSGSAPAVVDGVSLGLNDRVLVTGQSTGSENGIYSVTTVGAGQNGTWARSSDADAAGEIKAGSIIMVTEGTVNADTQWKLTTDDPITIGQTALTFARNGNNAYGVFAVAGQSDIVADGVGDTLTVVAGTNIALTTNASADTLTITPSLTPAVTTLEATGNITGGNLITAGSITSSGLTYPTADGTSGQAIITDASGNLSFGDVSGGGTGRVTFNYAITGTPTTVTGADSNGDTLAYTAGQLDVFVNGVRMAPADITATNGTSVVFGDSLADGDIVDIVTYTAFDVVTNNADDLSSGTVPDARFPATLPAISGANLTNLDATDLTGTIASARIAGAYTGITSVGTLTGLTTSGNIDLSTINTFVTGGGHNVVQVDATKTYLYGGTGGIQVRTADNASALVDITNAGLVGIGTSSPADVKLSIFSGGAGTAGQLKLGYDNTAYWQIGRLDPVGTGSGNFQIKPNGGTSVFDIDSSGNVTTQGATTTLGSGAAGTNFELNLNGVASKATRIQFREGTTNRWLLGQGAASETSAFELYNSAGTMALSVNRSTNLATFANGLTLTASDLTVASGIVIHNGVSTYSAAFQLANNVAYSWDVDVGNEGGSGNIIEVHAMYDHYYNFAYGASLITLVGKRSTNISQSDIKNITSGNGGSWTLSAPSSTTLRITKNAGSYTGAGFGHIMVRFRKS